MPRRKKPSTAEPLLLTIPDVAIQLGVCRNTVFDILPSRERRWDSHPRG